MFLIKHKSTDRVDIAEFHGNSSAVVNKYDAKIRIQPSYSLLSILSRGSKGITYRRFGLEEGGKSSGCARCRIYTGERYQKNIVQDDEETSLEEPPSQPSEPDAGQVILDAVAATNDTDYFSKKWESQLQRFAVTKKLHKKIFKRANATKGFRLAKSKIHGRGLFATRDFERGEEVIEYMGELVRPIIADIREQRYRQKGQGNYLFKLDDDNKFVIDAANFSSMARFINHSCFPNCVVTNFDDERLVISANQRIPEGGEFSFDYGYGGEIDCNCGAPNCIGSSSVGS